MLTQPDLFDFPTDVSRHAVARTPEQSRASPRSPHAITPPLDASAVDHGLRVFDLELAAATAGLVAGAEIDAMVILRAPVARSTTAAVLPELDVAARDRIGDLVLAWVDALGPVIASRGTPSRWGRTRRAENRAREALHAALTQVGCHDAPAVATVLAAGIQVPVAAGAWLLVQLAGPSEAWQALRSRPGLARSVAWETVRLCPPTWITARITTEDVVLGATRLATGSVVMVSPLLLGRLETLAPGLQAGEAALDRFDPLRWDQARVRPGAWVPFGAGPHACPGRNLGLAQLTQLAHWARGWIMTPVQQVRIDQSRGIFPHPAVLRLGAPDPAGSDPGRSFVDGSA